MEKFKQKVQQRTAIMGLVMVVMAVVFTYLSGFEGDLPSIPDFIKGFHSGIFTGLELILVFFTAKNLTSMKNETVLKKLYIEETDERTAMIMQKTGAMGMTICMIGLAAATVVSGFYNEVVFFSLLGATIFTALIKGFFKLYYHYKF
ncbi:MAG: hypothetical protein K0R55_4659 [Sporomusa sp.]|nr:hypothetical protein [Sporomusa sp.]